MTNMRHALEVFGSFGLDNHDSKAVVTSVRTAKKRSSLLNRAAATVTALKSRNKQSRDPDSRYGREEGLDDSQRYKPTRDRTMKGESRPNMVISIKPNSKTPEDEDSSHNGDIQEGTEKYQVDNRVANNSKHLEPRRGRASKRGLILIMAISVMTKSNIKAPADEDSSQGDNIQVEQGTGQEEREVGNNLQPSNTS